MAVDKATPPNSTPLQLAFVQLSQQWAEISESLVRDYHIDNDDLLLSELKHIATKAIEILKNTVYSLQDHCKDLDFIDFVSTTGIAYAYSFVDFDYEVHARNWTDSLERLIEHQDDSPIFKRDLLLLLKVIVLLDLFVSAIISMLNSQRGGGISKDEVWQTIATIRYEMGDIEGRRKAADVDIDALLKKAVGDARSNNARNSALKRIERDPKEVAMQAIEKEHEALKPHQKTKGYLAPFTRAMQIKYPVLENPESIARRIRRLKSTQ
jgi:hypothetical protein